MSAVKDIFKQIISAILIKESILVLKKNRPKIIAITGSVGKTSTKDAIFTVLAGHFRTRKSQKSYNSEMGIPLTILGLKSAWLNPLGWLKIIVLGALEGLKHDLYPERLVLEVGADRPGDIRKMTKWLKPDIGVLTRLPNIPAHIEFFSDREAVVREKIALAQGVRKDGYIIYNSDDTTLHDKISILPHAKITYGFNEPADLRASNAQILYENKDGLDLPIGLSFKVDYRGQIIPIRVRGVLGKHQIYSVLGAIAVAIAEGLNIVVVAETIQNLHETPPGRLRLLAGVKNSVILDDTYNSSPAALEAALLTVGGIKSTGRKIAVLGDMLELGEHTIEAHRAAGELVAKNCDMLLTVGLRSKFIEEKAREIGLAEEAIKHFDNSSEAGEALDKIIEAGDVVLIKGSQGMRMEKAVVEIMAEPLRAEELLCRQEEEWLKR
ncbi:MAG: hypothetical protein A2571_02785 [Candidatus Vogelbacteria bacterium RIFOXYD1_FULL_44_32]|uniref:UDP-N-acetylmuramoyl-tripeptide--D-alanyl-D-alanine ligase n=1 Tax=Candidatus Vogelbacteria bacterium RIFOXYD1_FULL_44_32 TaxID=1802438 RepID=A0A1G2QDK9_9BACT|nr:MAG: hypothetical protein A2571_02785 [Candidatus Vogelbacteria bacterium RIFOXYD1_FULL_44_32]